MPCIYCNAMNVMYLGHPTVGHPRTLYRFGSKLFDFCCANVSKPKASSTPSTCRADVKTLWHNALVYDHGRTGHDHETRRVGLWASHYLTTLSPIIYHLPSDGCSLGRHTTSASDHLVRPMQAQRELSTWHHGEHRGRFAQGKRSNSTQWSANKLPS